VLGVAAGISEADVRTRALGDLVERHSGLERLHRGVGATLEVASERRIRRAGMALVSPEHYRPLDTSGLAAHLSDDAAMLAGRPAGLAGVRLIDLDVLPRDQAVRLLVQIIGDARVAAEPDAAEELVERCGRLHWRCGSPDRGWPHGHTGRSGT